MWYNINKEERIDRRSPPHFVQENSIKKFNRRKFGSFGGYFFLLLFCTN